ncbi:MAG: RluA family pseudouridine synthase [Patescibacteria group bacterium]
MAYFNFIVPANSEPERLDKFLVQKLPQYSRSFLTKCKLRVNGEVKKPSVQISAGDQIKVAVPALKDLEIKPEKIPLKIIHEDSEILVLDKASGMVVHPTDHGGHVSGTLVNALLHHCKDLPGAEGRPGLVHRLDRDTSGVMVVAKTEGAKKSLTKQFADRKVEKTYLALVAGRFKDREGLAPRSLLTAEALAKAVGVGGRIEAPIGRDQRDRTKRKVSTAGDAREATTEFKVREEFGELSLLEVKLLTGRTHQIRVHFLSIKHPVIGDPLYGSKKINTKTKSPRLFLHAWKLAFAHPQTGKRVEFESELPAELEEFLKKLRA